MKKILPQTTAWFPVLLWMLLIFVLSGQTAPDSDQLSKGLINLVLPFIDQLIPVFGNGTPDDLLLYLDHLVRKLTHFLLYLVLGVLSVRALVKNQVSTWKSVTFSVLICLLYAMTDEWHQVFVPGRSGQPSDVLIDSLGALAGALFRGSRN